MKTIYSILFICLINCSSIKNQNKNDNALYFYFEPGVQKEVMEKSYSGFDKINNIGLGDLKYNYRLDSTNVIFISKDKTTRNNPKRVLISNKDTSNFEIKNFKWLNTFTNNWKNIVELRNSNKEIYLIEKDTLNNQLFLINVVYTQEIE
ncbi:hypothetical protein MWU76_08475 [Gelidibacter sp. F2691]|nr:hypothetical protein [Gelidibacter sp. F2691]